jgi:hypothetical protein
MNQQGRIEIPKPCHENWADMSQQEQGRHCDVCCKVVIDFTAMPTEKVIEIIAQKKSEKICGRFRNDQLHVNRAEVKSPRNRYRVFMAALYFVFGGLLFTSCNSHKNTQMGGVKMENFTEDQNGFNNLDTPSSRTRNKIDHPVKLAPTKKTVLATDTVQPEVYKVGEVAYVPEDTTKH